MKQRVTFTKIETIEVDMEAPGDVYTKAHAEGIANMKTNQLFGDGQPYPGFTILTRDTAAWVV